MFKKNLFLRLIVLVSYFNLVATAFISCNVGDGHKVVALTQAPIVSRTVTTLYGTFVVSEPVLIELMDSVALQRLKDIHQYGMRYLIDHVEYTRYDHSIGVWALLRRFGAGLNEQIAGLLHDVSHTVFSHVGDFLFKHSSSTGSYQDSIHEWYLKSQHVPEILEKYGISIGDILYKGGKALMLEQDLPEMCADRLEYNLKADLLYGFLNENEIEEILKDVSFEDGKWFFKSVATAKKFALLTVRNGATPANFIADSLAAEILKRAIEIKLITFEDVHFSVDTEIWNRLRASDDEYIQETIKKMLRSRVSFDVVKDVAQADELVWLKFRGIDPLVSINGALKRLSECDKEFLVEYTATKERFRRGIPIRFKESSLRSIGTFAHIIS